MKRLIEKYNTKENILLISSYPEKGVRYSKKVCAVGGFAKNTIEALQEKNNKAKYVVLTTTFNGKSEIYEENNILVIRLFRRNKISSYLPLIKAIFTFNKIKNVIIEFEFSSWGNTKTTSIFVLIFLLLKILAKRQVLILHQVITNLTELKGHLGWKSKDWRSHIYNAFIKVFYLFTVLLNDKIVVTEEIFKRRLTQLAGNSKKISVIPHGVDTNQNRISKKRSRQILKLPNNKFLILYFGYLGWYKGADLFLKFARKSSNKNMQFIIAGGPSFSNSDKKHYQKYLKTFKNLPKNIKLTGFVDEKDIKLYYSATDIVALPYRTMMSSSGPLSLAFTFRKPVLLSNKLKPYIESKDFKEALKTSKVNKKDIFFALNSRDFYKKIKNADLNKLRKFSDSMRKKRNYFNIVQKYAPLLFQEKTLKLENWSYLRTINKI